MGIYLYKLVDLQGTNFWGADLYHTYIKNSKGICWFNSRQHTVWETVFEQKNYDLADKIFRNFLEEK